MHKLLIEHGLDGFTVLEARDLWLSLEDSGSDSTKARKRYIEQFLTLKKKNWLRYEGSGRNKRYFQTERFKGQSDHRVLHYHSGVNHETTEQDYSILLNERNEYKGELEIVLGEVDEYQSIISRFPDLEKRLAPIHQQAKERAALLLGKINALTTVLNTLSTGSEPC